MSWSGSEKLICYSFLFYVNVVWPCVTRTIKMMTFFFKPVISFWKFIPGKEFKGVRRSCVNFKNNIIFINYKIYIIKMSYH